MKSNIILKYQYRPISITETVQCTMRFALQRGSPAKTACLILISHKHHIKINQPVFLHPHVSGFVAFLTVHTYACHPKALVCLSTSLPERQFPQNASFARVPACQSASFGSLPERQFYQSASLPECQFYKSVSSPERKFCQSVSSPERKFCQSASLPECQFHSAPVLQERQRT